MSFHWSKCMSLHQMLDAMGSVTQVETLAEKRGRRAREEHRALGKTSVCQMPQPPLSVLMTTLLHWWSVVDWAAEVVLAAAVVLVLREVQVVQTVVKVAE